MIIPREKLGLNNNIENNHWPIVFADIADGTLDSGFANPARKTRYRPPNWKSNAPGKYDCPNCGNSYKWYRALHRHIEYECGKPPRFNCPYCNYAGKHRSHVYSHIRSLHGSCEIYAVEAEQPVETPCSIVKVEL